MAQGINPRTSNLISLQIMQQEFEKARLKVDQLKDSQLDFKNRVDKTALAAKELDKALVQADKDAQTVAKQNAKITEGYIRSHGNMLSVESNLAKTQANNVTRQSQRIAQLQTQYRVAYEEINKYIHSNTKMSEAVFIRLQGRITAIGDEIRRLGALPPMANPLEGKDFDKYSSQFSKWTDFFASLKHHVTWMASAAAIGLTLGIPAKTVSTIAEVEKQMAQMKQVNEGVRNEQEILNKTTQDFIGIAQKYGHSVDEIIKSGVLWGRAYKDLNTVMQLTNLSAKLAVADNMNVDLANRAVESVINGYQKQGQAIQFATHVVDSWTKIAHNAQSSATDLAEALMRTGAAAKAVGVDFDTTNALASTMIKATGRSGAEVGRVIAA
jgi:hypothetical protein